MKTKLHLLAIAILLAAAPALADDLLDAVLWDGPSAFPSQTEPAPEPPPPSAPEPSPAPSYPSRSSYATLPPAPVPSATATVPAATEPVSVSGEKQICREIEEMRARADRLEAALGPSEPPKPARPPYDRADWPERARLSLWIAPVPPIHGLDMAGGEFVLPVPDTPFDLAVRAYSLDDDPGEKQDYLSSNRRSVFHEKKEVLGAAVWGIWYPWRNAVVSPHVGVGIGYESTDGSRDYWEYRGSRWNAENGWHKELDDDGLTLAGRVGATLTYQRLTLKGEFILTSETKTLLAEAGLRVWEHLVLNALVERYDVDISDACTAFGGGITILF